MKKSESREKKRMRWCGTAIAFMGMLSIGTNSVLGETEAEGAALSGSERRLAVAQAKVEGEEGVQKMLEALGDKEAMVRRAAIRKLAGALDQEAVQAALKKAATEDSDPLVRRVAFRYLGKAGSGALDALKQGLEDKDVLVRMTVVEVVAGIEPRTPETTALLESVRGDKDESVSRLASDALWTFTEDVRSSRDRPEVQDFYLSVVQTIPLEKTGWKFKRDSGQVGHTEGWQNADFNAADWADIEIERSWQSAGHKHDGVAWYRKKITLPEKPDYDGVDLIFESIDESAWIWVNGKFAGAHDLGPAGYNQLFAVDVGDKLQWGEENVIAVRVLKRTGTHAGIYAPARIEVLKKK